MTNQKPLNEIFGEFEILLNDVVLDGNYLPNFDIIKEKLRQLFIRVQKQNSESEKKLSH